MQTIIRTNSTDPDFRKLILQLDKDLQKRYGDVQAEYDKHNVIENIETVVVAYSRNKPVGCGCFKKISEFSVEIKRMFILRKYRGRGISKKILTELENWARELGYNSSMLETGNKQYEAIGLYSNYGYERIENYGPYVNMPMSLCFRKMLR